MEKIVGARKVYYKKMRNKEIYSKIRRLRYRLHMCRNIDDYLNRKYKWGHETASGYFRQIRNKNSNNNEEYETKQGNIWKKM